MSIRFYYWPKSSAARVWWALEELGLPYEKVRLYKEKGEHKAESYLAINPNGVVPGLTDGGARVFESLSILLYLAEKYGVEKGLWPAIGSDAAGDAFSWTTWGSVTMEPPTVDIALHASDLHYALPKEKRDAQVAEKARVRALQQLGLLERRLSGRPYTLGNDFTLADVANVPIIGRLQMCKVPLDAFPSIVAWMRRCTERAAFSRVMHES